MRGTSADSILYGKNSPRGITNNSQPKLVRKIIDELHAAENERTSDLTKLKSNFEIFGLKARTFPKMSMQLHMLKRALYDDLRGFRAITPGTMTITKHGNGLRCSSYQCSSKIVFLLGSYHCTNIRGIEKKATMRVDDKEMNWAEALAYLIEKHNF